MNPSNNTLDKINETFFSNIFNKEMYPIKLMDWLTNFADNHTILVGTIIGVITGLLIGSPWIRFRVEKIFRNIFRLPLLSTKLTCRRIDCKDGIVLFHGLTLRNRMWFTNTIPITFCSINVTLNWSTLCKHLGTIWDEDHKIKTIKEFRHEYYRCLLKQTQDDSQRTQNIYRTANQTIYILMEECYYEDSNLPLNSRNKIGNFYLNSRNLAPPLHVGWSNVLNVRSYDFGLIEQFHVEIPSDLCEKEPIDRHSLLLSNRETCLYDIGAASLSWPLRLNIKRINWYDFLGLKRKLMLFQLYMVARKHQKVDIRRFLSFIKQFL